MKRSGGDAGASGTVTIGEYLYRGDAEIGRALLASEGIPSMVKAEDEGGLNPGFYSDYRVTLQVNEVDAPVARDILGLEQPLALPDHIRQAMIAHANWAFPNEACGLIAGTETSVDMLFCLSNRMASPIRYSIDPSEHFGAMRYAERFDFAIIGAWHSHPDGVAAMSEADVAESPGGSWVTVVVGSRGRPHDTIRAFRTADGAAIELELAPSSTA